VSPFQDYIDHGWQLCAIPAGSKGPTYHGWNTAGVHTPGPGAGLLHALSGTCAIDLDNLQVARKFLAANGVDIDALLAAPDAVQIVSGRANRAKLLYALPTPLPSRKLAPYEHLVDGKQYHALELRCAARNGTSVQDVLPPSIHPATGKPYAWKFGHPLIADWRNLPPLPDALMLLWGGVEVHKVQPVEMDWEHPLLAAPPAAAEPDTATLAELRYYLDFHDPDSPYEEWVAVGMALHDATGGGPEGLALWDEWSRRGSKYGQANEGQLPQYPVDKWPSFTAGSGYTIAYLKSKAPAALESFPVLPEVEFAATAAPLDTRPGAIVKRALEPLVFVSSQGGYYDSARRTFLNREAIDDLYTPLMPVLQIAGNNGQVKTHVPVPRDELRRAPWKEEVYGLGMHPGEGRFFIENDARYLNVYRPQMAAPLVPTARELNAFNLMWSLPDEEIFRDWLKKFFAYVVQHPGDKITMAPLLVGYETGSGKNTIMKVMPQKLFGSQHFTVMDGKVLQSSFSDQLANAWWIYFEELHSGTDKAERIGMFNRVKPWITDDTVLVHPKGGKPFDAPNRIQVLGTSNYEDDALHLDASDRRWCIGHIEKSLTADKSGTIYEFLNSERAPGVLRHIFMDESTTGFNPKGRAPETRAKRAMVRVNYGTAESEILELIATGAAPFDKDLVGVADLLHYVKRTGMTAQRLGRVLQRKPFSFTTMPSAYGTRLLAWRNADLWRELGPSIRRDYHGGVAGRPAGWEWSDELPPGLAEACGLAD